MVHPAVDLRPKRAHDVFAGGRNFLKVVRFQIKMSILPGFNRTAQRFSKCNEIRKEFRSFIVISANRRFSQIKMAVPRGCRIFQTRFAFFSFRKRWNMQSMGSAKTHLRSEKYVPVSPSFQRRNPRVRADGLDELE